MDLSILAYFVAIADEMSFSSAAEDLFLSQSSLSKRIKKFEQELGVDLFYRDSHRLSLSPAGENLLPYARRVTIEMDIIRNHLAIQPVENNMQLRLASFSLMTSYRIDQFFSRFILEHSELDISLSEMKSQLCMKMLRQGRLDGCLIYDYGNFPVEEYTMLPIFRERLVAVMSRRHPLASRARLPLRALMPYKIYMTSSHTEGTFLEILSANSYGMQMDVEELGTWLPSLPAILENRPDCLSVLPEQVALHYGLYCVPISDAKPMNLSLVFRSDAILPAFPTLKSAIEEFFDCRSLPPVSGSSPDFPR